ncbi:MAG TPA: ABC transporter permease [Gemmatimonadaceae bacterium]|nr:ABC transporter permease [Gemmatimonadaceae bacterium]
MDLPSELGYASRALVRRPGLSAAIVLSLALSIWMATSVFSVAYGVLARPLPYGDADRIVALNNAPVVFQPPGQSGIFGISRIIRESDMLVERAMYVPGASANLLQGDRPERVVALPVSDRFFATLGVPASLGRPIASREDVATVVLSEGLWRRSFAADESVIGHTVQLNGRPYTVIGVMPRTFAFPEGTDMWVSLPEPTDFYVNAIAPEYIGRLAPGVTLERAQATLRAQIEEATRARGSTVDDPIALRSLHEELSGGVRRLLHLLVGAALMVLLLGAVNAAMLLVAHVGRRRGEFGIRQALGASRLSLYRQLLFECLLLAAAGTALGVVIAVWTDDLLRLLLPSTMPRASELGIDRMAVLFAATTGVLAGAATGLLAGVRAARFDLARLHGSESKASSGVEGRRLLRTLVLAEIAAAFVLSTGAGLLTRSVLSANQVDLGFRPDAVTTFRLHLPDGSYPPAQQRLFVDRALSELRAIPGVSSAGVVNDLPLAGQMGRGDRIRLLDARAGGDSMRASVRVVTGGYFSAMGVPLLEGRTFSEVDGPDSPTAVILSESVARRISPSASPLGMRVQLFRREATIVGIVGDTHHRGPDQGPWPQIYEAFAQSPLSSLSFAVRSTGDVAAPVRRVVATLDPTLPVFDLRAMRDIVRSALAERRFALALVGLFSLFGVGLALFGVYAVASVMVVERTREIGIRVALGSSRSGVLRLVLREGMLMGAGGIAIGVLGATLLSPALAGLLFGVQAHDAATLASVASLMVGITLLGGAAPALRASRVHPMIALRNE